MTFQMPVFRITVSCLLSVCMSLMYGCAMIEHSANDAYNERDLSCKDRLNQYRQASSEEIEMRLAAETGEFQSLAEKALVYRAKTIEFYQQLESKMEAGKPLNGQDLDVLNLGMIDHLEIRNDLLKIAHNHECWLDLEESELGNNGMTIAQHTKGVMISLAAALVLYDNYLLAVSTFEENPKLRQLLNAQDSGYQIGKNELTKVSLAYSSVENRIKTRAAINLYEQRMESLEGVPERDPELSYLSHVIAQSPSYNMTKKWSPLFVIGKSLNLFSDVTVDTLNGIGREGVNLFSMAFGNTVGLVEMRKGKLYGKPAVEKHTKQLLQPGDILLEKTPFRLTDQFIPGHWGHAAIWVGNENQLKELGIWHDPLLVPYHQSIRNRHGVVEALRSGVTISTLSHFMNVDDMAVLRSRDITPAAQARIVLQAVRQVGKAYDFNFDVETTDKIVCSELIYHSYTDYQWPTKRTLGRSTISPDNIASKALGTNELDLVLLYLDGQPVNENPQESMKELLEITTPRLSASF